MEKIKNFSEFSVSLNESAIDAEEIREKIRKIQPKDTGDNGATETAFKAAVPEAREVKVKGTGGGWSIDFKVHGKSHRAELSADGKLKSMVYGAYDESAEPVEEGWKEVLIAGALALSAKGAKSQDRDVASTSPRHNVEYSVSSEKKSNALVLDFGTDFMSGRYKLSDQKSEGVEQKLREIGDFVKKHQNNDIKITIFSGESLVPNRDVDAGKDSTGQYRRLPKGGLAQRRASTMQEVVETFMRTLEKNGVMKGKWQIVVAQPKIGTAQWKPGDDPGQEKYTKEQFVKIGLEVTGETAKADEIFSQYAKDGEGIFNSARHRIGEIYVSTRETKDIRDQGNREGGHQDLLFKTIDKMGKFDGRMYLIPWQWWNKDRSTTTTQLTDEDFEYIKTHFEVKK
jgi:hypothetical protein